MVHVLLKPGLENFEHNFTSMLLLLLLSCFSRVRLFATPCIIADEAPLSTEFSRQENTGVGCHFLLQGMTINLSFREMEE